MNIMSEHAGSASAGLSTSSLKVTSEADPPAWQAPNPIASEKRGPRTSEFPGLASSAAARLGRAYAYSPESPYLTLLSD